LGLIGKLNLGCSRHDLAPMAHQGDAEVFQVLV
jgi:hypothetical protein